MPSRNGFEPKSPGSMSGSSPRRLRRTSHQARAPCETTPIAMSATDRLAALLPDEDAQHDAAHAEDREGSADEVDARGRR